MKSVVKSLLIAGLAAGPFIALPQPASAYVSVGISIGIAPPALPVYVQPVAPGPGYIWTPGYWAWGPDGYYWVPGTWVMPPAVGLLWTPGWWGWYDGYYRWHPGYWGPHIGFYGGINYGFGYFGVGYVGGYWRGGSFYYNRAVNNINVTNIHNVYVDKTVVNNFNGNTVNRVSYNGGRGGIVAQPDAAQRAAEAERHIAATPAQARQREVAQRDPMQRFSANQGHPQVAATPRAGHFQPAQAIHGEGAMARNEDMMQAPRPEHIVHAPPRPGMNGDEAFRQPHPSRPNAWSEPAGRNDAAMDARAPMHAWNGPPQRGVQPGPAMAPRRGPEEPHAAHNGAHARPPEDHQH